MSLYVRIEVVEAENLLPKDRNNLSDPFAVVMLNDHKAGAKETPICAETLNPKWDSAFTFKVVDRHTDTVTVRVMDYDKVGFNDFEGQCRVPVASEGDMWLPLLGKRERDASQRKKERGRLHVVLKLIDTGKKEEEDKKKKRKDYLIAHEELTKLDELGRGAFGVVYKGKWRLQDVAIKEMQEQLPPKEMAKFKAECELMAELRPHKHVSTFLGVSMDEGHPLCLVTDFVAGGSLESKLHDPQWALDWPLMLQLARGICAGMFHLHQEGIVHRDLAARNVLLGADNTPMVSDFGLSAKSEEKGEQGFFRGPYKWMAPESLAQNTFTEKSDVYSYGVTLWEMLTRSAPYPELDIYQAARKVVSDGLRPPIDQKWPPKWQQLLVSCFETDPDKRPDFRAVSVQLDAIESDMKQFLE